ncbi:EAL domain-containing protein [Grimontia kaedaensis]|uniref:EAL domain-containing protein n=1 Tax=Grimontia kaedaensis TaxID=2872157 RepID=A0ABY4WRR6_9GAMM|nr:EAL domain-containing protein [Grimontia kaedaensis]USH01213.1 EAL domain-containing protein [Grimontia kaedaensis]
MKFSLSIPKSSLKNDVFFGLFSFALVLLCTQVAWYPMGGWVYAQLFSVTTGAMVAVCYMYGKVGVAGQFFALMTFYTFINPIPSGVGYMYTLFMTVTLYFSVVAFERIRRHPHAVRVAFCFYVFVVPSVGALILALLAPNKYDFDAALTLYLTDSIAILITAPIIALALYGVKKPNAVKDYFTSLLKISKSDWLCKGLLIVGILLVFNYTDTNSTTPYLTYLLLAPLVTLAVFNFSELTQTLMMMIGFGMIFHSEAYDDIHTLNTRLSLFFMFSLIIYIMLEYKRSLRVEIEGNLKSLYFDKQSNFGSYHRLDADSATKEDFVVAALDLRPVFKYPLEKRDSILRQVSRFFEEHTALYEQCYMLYDVSALIILTSNSERAIAELEAIPAKLDDYLEQRQINFYPEKIHYCRCRKGIRIKQAVNRLNVNMRLGDKGTPGYVVDCDDTGLDDYIAMLEELHVSDVQILRQNYLNIANPDKVCFELLSRFCFDGKVLNTGIVFHCAQKLGYLEQLEHKIVMRQLVYLSQLDQDSFEYGSVNLTPEYLSDGAAVSELIEWVDSHHIQPNRVNIEVVESGSIDNPELLQENLNRLKERGFRLALDDFGAGHATYNQLLTMPVDTVKIDGSLVRNCITDPVKRTIIEDLRSIADTLKITIVAECVETEEEADYLKRLGIDYLQGYLVHKPMPV